MLENKTIVVTGAGGTLGKAVCARAESLGARIIGLDLSFGDSASRDSASRDSASGESASQDKAADQHAVDLLDLEATIRCVDSLDDFDGVVNLAGGFAMGSTTWEREADQWDAMFSLNVTTLRNMVKASAPRLIARGRGSMVNVGSYGAREGQALMSAYCAAKSTVMRLTESLSAELQEKGINVNAVLPTVIDTPPNRKDMPDANPADWVSPDELADVICFLSSDAARCVHGALVPIRGLA